MKVFKEMHHNNIRFDRLSKEKKAMANKMALNEFRKPVQLRAKPVTLLYRIEFK